MYVTCESLVICTFIFLHTVMQFQVLERLSVALFVLPFYNSKAKRGNTNYLVIYVFFFRQLHCTRVTIHKNLFLSYILYGLLWLLFSFLVTPEVAMENSVNWNHSNVEGEMTLTPNTEIIKYSNFVNQIWYRLYRLAGKKNTSKICFSRWSWIVTVTLWSDWL